MKYFLTKIMIRSHIRYCLLKNFCAITVRHLKFNNSNLSDTFNSYLSIMPFLAQKKTKIFYRLKKKHDIHILPKHQHLVRKNITINIKQFSIKIIFAHSNIILSYTQNDIMLQYYILVNMEIRIVIIGYQVYL